MAIRARPKHALFLKLLRQSPESMRSLGMYPSAYAEIFERAVAENRELTKDEIDQLRKILTDEHSEHFPERKEELVAT